MAGEIRVARSYRRGDWFGILGSGATVLLPASEKSRVPDLWVLVDDGAGFDQLLDALVGGGLSGLPAFVLVGHDGPSRVVVRGAATAVLTLADGSSEELDGTTAATWVERSVSDLASLSLLVAEPLDGSDLPIEDGLVRVARVDQSPLTASADSAATGDAASPAPPPGPDHDGLTRAGGGDPAGSARQHPGIPGQPPAPSVTAEPVARLRFSSGESVDVDRAVLIGRAPEARRSAATEQPRLVTVPSPQQEISSTHLDVRPGSGADHGSAVVTDLGSTNGTVLQQPGLPPEDLQPGLPVQLLPGAVVDLGDGVTIRIERA